MKWRILCYHDVQQEVACGFAAQLDWLAARGYTFCSLEEGLASGPQTRVTVSFDDGDATVCEVAQQILEERSIRGMLYVTTDYVQRGETYRDEQPRRAVTWEQLGAWLAAGHAIGSHTHTHADMIACTPQQRKEELERSREILRERLNMEVVHFAYPWGQHDADTHDLVRSLPGWHSAATIDRGWNGSGLDPYRLRRDLVEPDWTPARLRWRLAVGGCGPLYRIQRRLRGLPIPEHI